MDATKSGKPDTKSSQADDELPLDRAAETDEESVVSGFKDDESIASGFTDVNPIVKNKDKDKDKDKKEEEQDKSNKEMEKEKESDNKEKPKEKDDNAQKVSQSLEQSASKLLFLK